MRQRAITATFIPSVILADEPTTALDVVVQRGILMMLTRLQKQNRNTLVVVSHDMGVHYQITDRIGGMLLGKKIRAVDNVSIDISAEEPTILAIVGESGCGKSTLCKMILRIYKPDGGSILLSGRDYADKRGYDKKQFRKDVQPIFQNPYESFSARKPVDSYLFNSALRLGIVKTHAEAEKLIDQTLRDVGLSLANVRGKYSAQFSGGELQRVHRAGALTRPKLDHRRRAGGH